jgi:hypothetical protein
MAYANGPAREGGAERIQLATDGSAHSKSSEFSQDSSGAPLHLVGSPRVVIEHCDGRVFVRVLNPLWGSGNLDREYLTRTGKPGPKALAYAEELRQRHAAAAWAAHKRREVAAEARMAERIANARGIGGGQ